MNCRIGLNKMVRNRLVTGFSPCDTCSVCRVVPVESCNVVLKVWYWMKTDGRLDCQSRTNNRYEFGSEHFLIPCSSQFASLPEAWCISVIAICSAMAFPRAVLLLAYETVFQSCTFGELQVDMPWFIIMCLRKFSYCKISSSFMVSVS